MSEHVAGYCPMGCGQTLLVDKSQIRCQGPKCKRPDAISVLISEPESEHVITFTEDNFTILHPLRERLERQLEDCPLHKHLRVQQGPPVRPGRYRAHSWQGRHRTEWGFTPISFIGRVTMR